jgi:HD-GYP domain-containing protein (c-di-GMP phosphodiesterase class II)
VNVECSLRVADARMYAVKSALHDGVDFKQALKDEREEEALPSGRRPSVAEQRSYLDLVRMLAAAVDARDAYTQSHSLVVAELVAELYDFLDLPRAGRLSMRTAAMLHDVGKIGISDAILRKPGPLTAAERKEIELHPVLACDILHAIPRPEILPWIRGHHERWDGQGYPDALAGQEIPFEARMIAVCDAYDAITASRPYHETRSGDEGIEQIRAGRGSQFDPQLADAFLRMMASRRERTEDAERAPVGMASAHAGR